MMEGTSHWLVTLKPGAGEAGALRYAQQFEPHSRRDIDRLASMGVGVGNIDCENAVVEITVSADMTEDQVRELLDGPEVEGIEPLNAP